MTEAYPPKPFVDKNTVFCTSDRLFLSACRIRIPYFPLTFHVPLSTFVSLDLFRFIENHTISIKLFPFFVNTNAYDIYFPQHLLQAGRQAKRLRDNYHSSAHPASEQRILWHLYEEAQLLRRFFWISPHPDPWLREFETHKTSNVLYDNHTPISPTWV